MQRSENPVPIGLPNSDIAANPVPQNYFSKLPLAFGAFAGLMGSFAIMAIVAIMALAAGTDIFLSPRIIASALLGSSAETGVFAVIVGTVIHLVSGTVYGAIFAAIVPSIPRGFYIVAGLVFGMAIWAIAAIGLPFFIADEIGGFTEVGYFSVLIISHAAYGIFLGTAGALYGYVGRK